MVIGPRGLSGHHSGCGHMGEGPIREGVVLEYRSNE